VESGGRGVEEVDELGGDGGHGRRVAARVLDRGGSANRTLRGENLYGLVLQKRSIN
jgi:hypothetical protein